MKFFKIVYYYLLFLGNQLDEHLKSVDGLGDRINTALSKSSQIKEKGNQTEIIIAHQRLNQLKQVSIL